MQWNFAVLSASEMLPMPFDPSAFTIAFCLLVAIALCFIASQILPGENVRTEYFEGVSPMNSYVIRMEWMTWREFESYGVHYTAQIVAHDESDALSMARTLFPGYHLYHCFGTFEEWTSRLKGKHNGKAHDHTSR